jgi:Zn-dependent protease with chaperone function/tetratricopeptide (TPR) repeat protein
MKIMRCACLCGLIFALALTAFAQTEGRNMEKERRVWEQLEASAPKAVETFKAATVALDKNELAEAARLYEEVLKQAPQFDPALRRLGGSLMFLGRAQEGLAHLEQAIKINRSPENLGATAQALAYPGGNETTNNADMEKALVFAREAYNMRTGDDPYYPMLLGQIALDMNRVEDFRMATRVLIEQHQNLMLTHYFHAILAATDEEWETAEREIKRAESMGLSPEAAKFFLDSGVHTRAMAWRYGYYSLYLVAAWAIGLTLLFVLGKVLSNITLRSVETADPNEPAESSQTSLRKVYRNVINFAGLYYYISIPVIIFLVAALAFGVFYGFYLFGRIPIKLVALLAIGAILTIYQMIRSLFSRVKQEDPGRALHEYEAPGLWTLARDVAQRVGTRPVDEIRVTPGTDLAVYERGSFRERANDEAHRILILGVGALNGFSQNGFRAVLAHEYGHFLHRDTAGGDVALRVNSDMMRFANSMIQSGQATYFNIAFQFLRLYHFLFRRITHGATRLQEVQADRIAVQQFGAKAFEEGLTHAIRREVEFHHLTTKELNEVMETRRAMQNLYDLSEVQDEEQKTIAEQVNTILNRETTEDDTHPSPSHRFRLASRIRCKNEPPATGMVWELFGNREGLTKEMNALIDEQVRATV